MKLISQVMRTRYFCCSCRHNLLLNWCVNVERYAENILVPPKISTTSTDKKAKKSFDNFAAYLSNLSVERDYGKRDYRPDKIKDALRVGKLMVENLTDELCK